MFCFMVPNFYKLNFIISIYAQEKTIYTKYSVLNVVSGVYWAYYEIFTVYRKQVNVQESFKKFSAQIWKQGRNTTLKKK